ncbi:hypothetical protein HDF26_000615 [Pedobacter cryoconitis]|uniref:Uncharacterized protein n=1 Tax=Pedobacter cryoconitis TaxID=188932 RepID=A0A7W8ZRN8_9SPHI|nr:hypothetical protein [Pedobacter cryoconitis]MBB5638803.1 hypothetical protein [Pedobacter cryoconitis]MBB6270188.1 hypothetical protein [Pedobacter cryoconitis]
MSEIKQSPVLKHIVSVIKNAIADSKVEVQSESVSIIKDGNDSIHITHLFDSTENIDTIFFTDKKEILFSEDLLETLQDIEDTAKSDAGLKKSLKAAAIVVNDLSIEMDFIFQAARAAFDELSDSYEFVKATEKNIEELTAQFKFGDNKFDLTIKNVSDKIHIGAQVNSAVTPAVTKTIEADVAKIEQALNKMFK